MREIRTYGSAGGETGSTGLPYPDRRPRGAGASAPESVLDREGVSPSQACALRPVTEGKGVAVRRGPKQLEVNCRSAG